MLNFISKKYSKFIQNIFILSCITSLINCASEEEAYEAHTIGGMGEGTFAVMIAILVGVLLCILGLAFSSPGIFVFLGILLPLIVFIICISLPIGNDKEEKDESINEHYDYYIFARYFYFIIMLIVFIGLLFGFFLKWNITVIPQRVNSNTMKDTYDDKYLEDLEKQKKRKYNLENDSIDDEERLPLSSNKKKKSAFIRLDKDENEIANDNLLDNNLVDENTLPMATVKRKDEFNENRGKFKKFKRIQNSN